MITHELNLDKLTRQLCDSQGHALSELPSFVRGDDQVLRISYVNVNRTANPYTLSAAAIEEGSTFTLVAKKKGSMNGEALVNADNDAFNIEDDWDDIDLAQGKFSVRMSMKLPALKTLMDAEGKPSMACVFDISVTDPDGNEGTILHQEIPIENDAHRGDESISDETAESYYQKAEADARFVHVDDDESNLRYDKDSKTWYAFNPDTNLYHAVRAKIVDGSVQMVLDQAGVSL